MSTVKLVGGPCDGQIVTWEGGDLISMAPLPDVSISHSVPRLAAPRIEIKTYTYRQSLKSPDLFVYQP